MNSKRSQLPLCERHNYFIKLDEPVKLKARSVLTRTYTSKTKQAADLLRALQLKPTYKKVTGKNKTRLVTVEFDCDYDVLMFAEENFIHDKIIEYFRIMLMEPGAM